MNFPFNRHDALSSITDNNYLCCPNCQKHAAIEMLGITSYTKRHPKIKCQESILSYSLWFYCKGCFTEFGSTFASKEIYGSSYVTVNSNIQKIVYNKKKQEESQKPLRKAISPRLRYEILKKYNYQCRSCGATVDDGEKLEIDHIVPVSKGGTNEPSNLQVLCKTCNLGKSNKH